MEQERSNEKSFMQESKKNIKRSIEQVSKQAIEQESTNVKERERAIHKNILRSCEHESTTA